MATAKRIPLPQAKPRFEDRKMLCAEIQSDLLEAARAEQMRRKVTMRQVMEWSLSMFVMQSNPQLARQLGIDKSEAR